MIYQCLLLGLHVVVVGWYYVISCYKAVSQQQQKIDKHETIYVILTTWTSVLLNYTEECGRNAVLN